MTDQAKQQEVCGRELIISHYVAEEVRCDKPLGHRGNCGHTFPMQYAPPLPAAPPPESEINDVVTAALDAECVAPDSPPACPTCARVRNDGVVPCGDLFHQPPAQPMSAREPMDAAKYHAYCPDKPLGFLGYCIPRDFQEDAYRLADDYAHYFAAFRATALEGNIRELKDVRLEQRRQLDEQRAHILTLEQERDCQHRALVKLSMAFGNPAVVSSVSIEDGLVEFAIGRLADYETRILTLAAALRKREWVDVDSGAVEKPNTFSFCAECGSGWPTHKPDCGLAAALGWERK